MTARMIDNNNRIIRLTGVAETVFPVRYTSGRTAVEILVSTIELEKQCVRVYHLLAPARSFSTHAT
jgi:hypothetical protein